ncbi:MAG TPA: gamma-glutamyltransferase [Candidatus Binatia bacterium]|nr:gamma-glutamyltransferase [Candidatus Binatia bacterium]
MKFPAWIRRVLFSFYCFAITIVPLAGYAAELTDLAKYSPFVATGRQGMVVTAGEQASEAGVEMLRRGGNAVDAAVAASFAVSVIRPQSTGIGGGGFFLLYLAKSKETLAIDFRERAPIRATPDMFLRDGKAVAELSRNGPLAVAVPGLVAGLVEGQKKYGSMPLKEVMAPAIHLADEGFPIYPQLAGAIAYRAKLLGDSPATRAIYFREDRPLREGELLVQKDLARTLREIAAKGKDTFYQGRVAKALVEEMRVRGGLITQEDLDRYRVLYRPPVTGTFRGAEIHAMPPPSSGGVLILQMLNVLDGFPLQQFGFHSPKAIHVLTETMRLAFRDRARYLGDPDFIQVPTSMLASAEYAADLRAKIDLAKAIPSEALPASPAGKVESTSTTHISVLDRDGNAVATTQTVNLYFGSGVMVPGTGVLLNDEMDDFSAQLSNPNAFGLLGSTDANAIAPRKTPLSSMSPTIVTRDGKVILIAGSPGGSRIISAMLQVLLNVLAYDMSLPEAMFAPRIHHQWFPDELLVELQKGGQPEGLVEVLRQMGHKVTVVEDTGDGRTPFGNVQAIQVDIASGQITGVSDPRGEGRPHGF